MIAFSVGSTVGADALELGDDADDEVSGAFCVGSAAGAVALETGAEGAVSVGFSFAPHEVSMPMPISAAALATMAMRRVKRSVIIVVLLLGFAPYGDYRGIQLSTAISEPQPPEIPVLLVTPPLPGQPR
ncbi:MAG: hypothetical protein ACKOQ4_03255 [Mycobacterium sp.]